MNIRCPECSTEFDVPDKSEDTSPREVFCPGCGHGFEFDGAGGQNRNKTQLGAMGHIDADEDAPEATPKESKTETGPDKTQIGNPAGKIPSPGQVADDAPDPADESADRTDDADSIPESTSPDYNPFPHAKEDVSTSPGRPAPGQEEPETDDRQENPSDPSFGAVEAESGESSTADPSPSDSAAAVDSGNSAEEDDFWSSDSGDEYDAFSPETGMDPSFDEDREFFDPDAPGSRTGGSRNEKSQKEPSQPDGRANSPKPGGAPGSVRNQSASSTNSGSSSSSQPPKQPPSPGIRSDSETTSTRTTPGNQSQTSTSSEDGDDRSWTGDKEPAVRSGNSTSLAQKVAHLALIVLLVVNGLLGWVAYKNDWMIDFVKFEQMLEVAFEGGTYEPREEWLKE